MTADTISITINRLNVLPGRQAVALRDFNSISRAFQSSKELKTYLCLSKLVRAEVSSTFASLAAPGIFIFNIF